MDRPGSHNRGSFIDCFFGEFQPADPITESPWYDLYVLRRVAPFRWREVAPDRLAMAH